MIKNKDLLSPWNKPNNRFSFLVVSMPALLLLAYFMERLPAPVLTTTTSNVAFCIKKNNNKDTKEEGAINLSPVKTETTFDSITKSVNNDLVTGTLTVTTASDVLDGDTTNITTLIGSNGADGAISLREAIIAANNTANGGAPDTIKFNIGGGGSQVITVNGPSGPNPNGTGFDIIDEPVVIDATTQPGYSGTPLITLDGISATGATGALVLETNNSTLKGFIVINFIDEGLEISGFSGFGDGNIIENNWVGINAAGMAAGNGDDGILVTSDADNNIIRNNIVGSNVGNGIVVRNLDANNNWVYANIVGLANDTIAIRPNGNHGIHLYGDALNNIIGTNADGSNDLAEANIVSGNSKSGIAVSTTSGVNSILGNRIYNNTLLGIDLGGTAGVTFNDIDDADTGPNDLFNFPVLTNVVQNGSDLDVYFDLDLPAGWHRIEFFENPGTVDPSGYGEGEIFLGAAIINATGAVGYEAFSEKLIGVNPSQIIGLTATATEDLSGGAGLVFGKTSEFGPGYLGPGTFEVTTVSDVLDGNTASITTLMGDRGSDGEISLREAITAANNTANGATADEIHFNIAGAGVHVISLASTLPAITDTLFIDGSTQPGFSGTPLIRIDGNALSGGIDAFTFSSSSDYSEIRSLMITRFPRHAFLFQAGADYMTVAGNWIGTDGSGATSMGNANSGIISQGSFALIGGTGPYDQNVIVNNNNEGISLLGGTCLNNTIVGNLIGLEPDGISGAGNGDVGIALLSSGGGGNTIGGLSTAARNVISMNFEGIEISCPNNIIQGNYFGTDTSGTLNFGQRSSDAVEIVSGGNNNTVGGTASGAGNLIAFTKSSRNGVSIEGGTGNAILGNDIHSNTGLGINIGATGVQSNDAGDGDSGANNLQNYPLLSATSGNTSMVTISGTFNSVSGTLYRIEFFASTAADPSGYGEGERYLGFTNITTDGSGNATINATLVANVTSGEFITATATDPSNNTSEFSANILASVENCSNAIDDDGDGFIDCADSNCCCAKAPVLSKN